jgi:hypothetical protein
MPKGGFGNLIALPLQKVPRESGFTEFLDDELRPPSTIRFSIRKAVVREAITASSRGTCTFRRGAERHSGMNPNTLGA